MNSLQSLAVFMLNSFLLGVGFVFGNSMVLLFPQAALVAVCFVLFTVAYVKEELLS